MQTVTHPIVVARPGALMAAMRGAEMSVPDVVDRIAAEHADGPRRAHVYNLLTVLNYGIRRDKAERIAAAVGVPVGTLFVHRDGAPLA